MSKVWCTCYRCQKNIGNGSYVSKSTRTCHRNIYQPYEQEYNSSSSSETLSQFNETEIIDIYNEVEMIDACDEIEMVDTFRYNISLKF